MTHRFCTEHTSKAQSADLRSSMHLVDLSQAAQKLAASSKYLVHVCVQPRQQVGSQVLPPPEGLPCLLRYLWVKLQAASATEHARAKDTSMSQLDAAYTMLAYLASKWNKSTTINFACA